MKQLLICALLCTCLSPIWGQNLVPNGNFEQYNTCELYGASIDTSYTQYPALPFWSSATVSGTPDYFNECFINPNASSLIYDVPNNHFGSQPAKSGAGYAGIGLLLNYGINNDLREYLQTRLTEPLVAGQTYCVGFYTSLGVLDTAQYSNSTIAINNWGILLSSNRPLNPVNDIVSPGPSAYHLPGEPQIKTTEFVRDTTGWTFIGGTYTAQGGETWLTIGNFNPIGQTPVDTVARGNFGENAYYFIDDVFVVPQSNAALLGPDTALCTQDFPLQLFANPGFTNYQWASGQTTPDISAPEPGTYALQANFEGCTVRDTITLTAATQQYTPLPDVQGCQTNPVDIQIDPAFNLKNIKWSNNAVGERFQTEQEGMYWFIADGQCASVSDTFFVQLDTIPLVALGPDVSICNNGTNQPITLSNTVPLSNYLWSNGAITPNISVDQWSTLTLSTTNRCGTFSDQINVAACDPEVYIPNVFSPLDPDPQNRVFRPFFQNAELLSFRVFDRWGSLIFEQKGDGNGWDGSNRDKLCNPGVYWYIATLKNPANGDQFSQSGDVTLLR